VLTGQEITFIGCTKGAIPPGVVGLQTVSDHPEANWVKWSVRHHRTPKDRTALDHPFAKYFKNPLRLRFALGDGDFVRLSAGENARYIKFHGDNLQLLDALIQVALARISEGRNEYSVRQLLGEARWGDIEIDRGADKVKIREKWSPWYSRVFQMVEARCQSPALLASPSLRGCHPLRS
jgi:hypothetical protein